MQQAMSVPDPIAAYDPTGHTNEDMAEYPVLTDLTGNGHDITLNNFAWSGMSGVDGYPFPPVDLSSPESDGNKLISQYSVKVTKTGYTGMKLCILKQNESVTFKYRIEGFKEDYNLWLYTYSNNVLAEIKRIIEDGDYEDTVTNTNENSLTVFLACRTSMEIPDMDMTITILPEHKGALVSDGVDDYGICENFPILTKEKGYTVVAVRKWLGHSTELNDFECMVSNCKNWNQDGAFLFEYENGKDTGIAISFGGINIKMNFPDLFSYQTSISYNGTNINTGEFDGTDNILLFTPSNSYKRYSQIALYSLEIYDRDLTPYQIEAVKKRLMDKYNNPEDTTSDWYGVEWYTNQSPSRVMRIGNMDLHRTLPIQSGMYRCILNDNGEEVYKLDPNDSTKKEDGTPAVLDGTDGQVMVYVPVFYAWFESKGYRRRVMLSDHYKPGFIRMGGCYVSAYEATVDRTISTLIKLASVVNTTANFRGGNNNAEWDSTYRSLLGMPATFISLTNFRNYARNRNDGDTQWNCMDYTAYKAVYWLYVVEYADRNCQLDFNENLTSDGFRQGGLGAGVTNINSTKWNSFNGYYPFVPCGHTNSLGNKTGIVQFIMPFEYDAGGADNYAGAYDAGTPYTDGQFVSEGQDLYECIADAAAGTSLSDTTYFTNIPRTSTHVPSYRGIENIFGHIWKWTDGVHIKVQSEEAGGKSILYTSDNPANYQDTDYEGYEEKGYVARTNGYVRDIIFGRDGDFYVSEDGATGGFYTTYFSDYSYMNIPESGESLRGLLLGGHANDGSIAGLVFVYSNYGPSATSAYFGSRLCYIPNN